MQKPNPLIVNSTISRFGAFSIINMELLGASHSSKGKPDCTDEGCREPHYMEDYFDMSLQRRQAFTKWLMWAGTQIAKLSKKNLLVWLKNNGYYDTKEVEDLQTKIDRKGWVMYKTELSYSLTTFQINLIRKFMYSTTLIHNQNATKNIILRDAASALFSVIAKEHWNRSGNGSISHTSTEKFRGQRFFRLPIIAEVTEPIMEGANEGISIYHPTTSSVAPVSVTYQFPGRISLVWKEVTSLQNNRQSTVDVRYSISHELAKSFVELAEVMGTGPATIALDYLAQAECVRSPAKVKAIRGVKRSRNGQSQDTRETKKNKRGVIDVTPQ